MKYRPKLPLRPYQVKALKKMLANDGGGLFMSMRAGKTAIALHWAGILHLKYGVKRILIVTHSPTTFGVWRNEIHKHLTIPFSVNIQSVPEHSLGLPDGPEFLILNIQRVYDRRRQGRSWTPRPSRMLRSWRPEVIIVDESTCIGDPQSVQSRFLYKLQKDLGVKYKLIITGTPAHRKLWGVFGQFKFLDDSVFGTSLTAHKAQFGLWGGYQNYVLLRYRNLKLWRSKIEPLVYQLVRIPYRPPVNQVIPVDLSPATQELYDEMATESLVKFHSLNGQVTVEATIILTRLLKCSQLAAGWIRDADKVWHRVGTELRDSFQDHMQHLYDSEVTKVVVYARHIPELRDAAQAAKAAGYKILLLHGGVKHMEREARIAKFHAQTEPTAFIIQISTGSMGIDLSCADTAIFYTLTESLLHHDQACARIRTHADKRSLTYYYFCARGTIQEAMFLAIQNKINLVDLVMRHPELIHREEQG